MEFLVCYVDQLDLSRIKYAEIKAPSAKQALEKFLKESITGVLPVKIYSPVAGVLRTVTFSLEDV